MRAAQEAWGTSGTRLDRWGPGSRTRLQDPAPGPGPRTHNRRSSYNSSARPRGRAGAPPTSLCCPRAAPPLLSAAAAAAATTRSFLRPLRRLTLQPCRSGTLEDPPDSAWVLFIYIYFAFLRRLLCCQAKSEQVSSSADNLGYSSVPTLLLRSFIFNSTTLLPVFRRLSDLLFVSFMTRINVTELG